MPFNSISSNVLKKVYKKTFQDTMSHECNNNYVLPDVDPDLNFITHADTNSS